MNEADKAADTAKTLRALRRIVERVGIDDDKRRKVIAGLNEAIDAADAEAAPFAVPPAGTAKHPFVIATAKSNEERYRERYRERQAGLNEADAEADE